MTAQRRPEGWLSRHPDGWRHGGRVSHVFFGLQDHGILTLEIGVLFDSGWHQTFGGMHLGAPGQRARPYAADLLLQLLTTFRVKELDQLRHRLVWGYYRDALWNSPMAGIGPWLSDREDEIAGHPVFWLDAWQKKWERKRR